jgi:hypothetical protein
MPRAKVVVMRAPKGRAEVRLIDTKQILWTATANLAFNEGLANEKVTKAPTSVNPDVTISNLPQEAGWALEGGKVCADNLALSDEADCPSPDVNTKCALAIWGAAAYVASHEEVDKFNEMSAAPTRFSKDDRILFLQQLRGEACPNYPSGTRVRLVLLDQTDQAIVLVPGNRHLWYTGPDNLDFGTALATGTKEPEPR